MSADKMMSLGILASGTGSHPASWIDPGSTANASINLRHYIDLAATAERGKLDFFFIADTPAARTTNLHCWSRYPLFMNVLDPVTLLSALAVTTSKIGLAATSTTSFNEPYNLARQFASLDHMSGGRAGWNVVTSANEYVAMNFGLDELPPHAERYERAREFVKVVEELWDTWEDDAFLYDRDSGVVFDPDKLHPVHHMGKHLSVRGALNIARPPQGRPVIVQAGSSEAGKMLAAETAEVVFASEGSMEKALAFYRDLKGRMPAFGRSSDELKILPGITVIIGDTREEAEAKYAYLQSRLHPDVGLQFLAGDLEMNLSKLPLDEPVPEDRLPKAGNLHKNFFDKIVETIRTEKPTLRELAMRYQRGGFSVRGTATEVADVMESWFRAGAADGFMVRCATYPTGFDEFVAKVVPELQRRGVFRKEYTGDTLRDHLGLQRPANRHVAAKSAATSAMAPAELVMPGE